MRLDALRTLLALLVLPASRVSSADPVAVATPGGDGRPEVRGMTLSCQTWGWEWGSDEFAAELDRLAELGIDWVAIHPYARIDADGRVRWRPLGEEPPQWLARPVREAHARGLAILIKPHLSYWGSPFRWRGEISFEDNSAWERFFATYRTWVVELARATRGADAFCVGTELDRTVAHEREWRAVIAAVRAQTDAYLTYAANWSDYREVPFWDALDVVGVQAYFPLCDHPDPSEDELLSAWRRIVGELRSFAARVERPLVLTELGYDRVPHAAARPWEGLGRRGSPGEEGRALQLRCLAAALDALGEAGPWLRGAFLWKWFAGPSPGEDFRLDTPQVRALLAERWGRRTAGPSPAGGALRR